MRRTFTLAIAGAAMAVAAAPPAPALAGFVAGTDLISICKTQASDPVYRLKAAECLGYIVGVADTFDCTDQLHGFHWNSSAPVSQTELVTVVTQWLDQHTDRLSYESDGLIAAALSTAFPCR